MWRTILIGMLFLAVSRPLMAQNDYATHFSKGRDIYLKANTLTGEEARELYRQAIEELVLARKIADKAGAKYYHALCLMALGQYIEAKTLLEEVQKEKNVPKEIRKGLPKLLKELEEARSKESGTIVIETKPDGAQVYIDNQHVGNTPLTVNWRIGTFELSVKKDGYREVRDKIEVNGGVSVYRSWNLILLKKGKVVVRSGNIEGAVVQMDGKDVGKTPLTIVVDSGMYELRVRMDGYMDYSEIIEVQDGGMVEKSLVLTPLARKRILGGYGIGGYTSLSLGGVFIIIGGVMNALALKKGDAANQPYQSWTEASQKYDNAQKKMKYAYAFYGIGGASLAASIVLLILEYTGKKKESQATAMPHLMIIPGDGGGEMGALFRF